MSMSAKLRRAPLRIVTGAYIVNSGISKFTADDDTAKSLHDTASGTYSFVGNMQPKLFARGLGVGEVAVGAAVLLPFVSPVVAGAALVGVSGALLNMYWNTPGMHREGSPLPTEQGMPYAKDVWLLGAGLGLMADAVFAPAHDKVVELETVVSHRRAKTSRRARRSARKAAEQLSAGTEASRAAARRLGELGAEYAPVAAKKARKTRDAARDAAEQYAPVAADKARATRDAARDAAEQYAPVAAKKARAAGKTARQWAEEFAPLAAEKARSAGETAKQWAEEYGPIAADKARSAGETAKQWAEEYGPVAAEKARTARDVALQAAEEYGSKARERVAG